MKRIYIVLFLAAFFFFPAPTQAQDSFAEKISILNAPEAPGTLSRERLAACLRLIALELQMDSRDLPNILVLHVTSKDAAAAGVRQSIVRRNFAPHGDPRGYYELWVVGQPRPVEYAAGLYNILENRMGHRLEDKQRFDIMRRALRYLEATVSAMGQ